MIGKYLDCVWQDLGKFKVANIASARSFASSLLWLLLELSESLERGSQALSLLINIVKLVGQ